MADTKISALTSLTGANVDGAADVLAIVDTSTGQTKKITRNELVKSLAVLTMLANNPVIRLDDSDSDSNGEITLDNTTLRIEVDEDDLVASSAIVFRVDAAEVARISEAGLILTTPDVPATASDTGTAGQIAWDASYLYVCTATNTWKRVAISTW